MAQDVRDGQLARDAAGFALITQRAVVATDGLVARMEAIVPDVESRIGYERFVAAIKRRQGIARRAVQAARQADRDTVARLIHEGDELAREVRRRSAALGLHCRP